MMLKQAIKNLQDAIIRSIKNCAAENDGIVTLSLYLKSKKPINLKVIEGYMGSWEEAVKQAGFKSETEYESLMLRQIRECVAENGNKKVNFEKAYVESNRKPSLKVIRTHFGTIQKALKIAFPPQLQKSMKPKSYASRYNRDEMLEQLRELAKKNGGKVTKEIYMRSGLSPSVSMYIRMFGSWNEAVDQAGLNPLTSKVGYTKEQAIKQLQACARMKGSRFISQVDYMKTGLKPTARTIEKMFDGGWNEALALAGLEHQTSGRPKDSTLYTDDELLAIIRECAGQVKGVLTPSLYKQMRENPTSQTIINRFGGWDEALEKAGVKTNQALITEIIDSSKNEIGNVNFESSAI